MAWSGRLAHCGRAVQRVRERPRSQSIFRAFSQLVSSPQRGPDAAQCVCVVTEIGPHGRGQREVLGGCARIARASERKAEAELRVIIGGASVDDAAEVSGRSRVLPGVELGAGECLEHAPGPRLGGCGALEELGGGSGTAPAEQVEATRV
jgi:hypothetical protein